MNTSEKHHEGKSKVVTFRVSVEEYNQIQEYKASSGLSNADLMRKAVGIGKEEEKAKLSEASGLEKRLSQLRAAVGQVQQDLDRAIAEERKRGLAELNTELEAFRLFDRGWGLDTVSFKLGIPHDKTYWYFQQWAEARNERQAVEQELVKECLRKHIEVLQQNLNFCSLLPSTPEERLKEMADEINRCYHLLQVPSEINDDTRAFLLAKYSRQLQPVRRKTKSDRNN